MGIETAIIVAAISASASAASAAAQAKSASNALKYQKGESARDQANFEATQKANYDQWLSRQKQLQILDQRVGMPAREIPPYVRTTGAGRVPAAAGGGSSAAPYIATIGAMAAPLALAALQKQPTQPTVQTDTVGGMFPATVTSTPMSAYQPYQPAVADPYQPSQFWGQPQSAALTINDLIQGRR